MLRRSSFVKLFLIFLPGLGFVSGNVSVRCPVRSRGFGVSLWSYLASEVTCGKVFCGYRPQNKAHLSETGTHQRAGIFGESYHIKDSHSQVGVILSLGIALLLIFFIGDPFKGLLISQMILSIQLPFTVFLQVGLTSSRKVMGNYVNSRWSTFVLYAIAVIVSVLNIMLLFS